VLTAVFVLAGYLSGSITWGYWLVRTKWRMLLDRQVVPEGVHAFDGGQIASRQKLLPVRT
jgi:hypothetical protein